MDVLIPGVAGIGEVIRGAKTVAIAAGAAEAAVGVAKGATKLSKKIDNLVDGAKSLGKKVDVGSSKTPGFDEWLNKGAANNKVYFGAKNGNSVYTGITKQSIDTRLSQHNRNGKNFSGLVVQHDNLTRNQARSIEQYYIENGPNQKNIINSISVNNQYYQNAMDWARQYLGK